MRRVDSWRLTVGSGALLVALACSQPSTVNEDVLEIVERGGSLDPVVGSGCENNKGEPPHEHRLPE